MVSILPIAVQQFSDNNGDPLVGGTVDMFVPGTSTPKTTWKDKGQAAANAAPIVLDSSGSAVIYGVGAYRQLVKDIHGNIIFDNLTYSDLTSDTGLTDLGISAAMVPIVTASTVKIAENLLALQGDHFQIAAGDQSLTVTPTANNIGTLSTMSVQAHTHGESPREFMVNFGLESNTGSTQNGDVNAGKVTEYIGLNATVGTGDIWTLNSCLTQGAGSGSYNAQGFELDFNNFNANRGDSGLITTDLGAPISYGMNVTGSGNFSSTSAIVISGANPTVAQWNRGITTTGRIGIASFHDISLVPNCMQFDGIYSGAALNFTSTHGNFGANCQTVLFMKNSMTLSWQNNATTTVISDTVDGTNTRIIGQGATSCTSPSDFTAPNHRMPNGGAVTWLRTGAPTGGSAYCFDWVDSANTRIVGSNATQITMGATTLPSTAGFNLGTSTNYWGSVFSNVGIAAPSDITLKTDVKPLTLMLDKVNAIAPISFVYKDSVSSSAKIHYGFDAQDIKDNFEDNFAGFHEDEEGKQWLIKEELIAVLWGAIKDLSAKVADLESRLP